MTVAEPEPLDTPLPPSARGPEAGIELDLLDGGEVPTPPRRPPNRLLTILLALCGLALAVFVIVLLSAGSGGDAVLEPPETTSPLPTDRPERLTAPSLSGLADGDRFAEGVSIAVDYDSAGNPDSARLLIDGVIVDEATFDGSLSWTAEAGHHDLVVQLIRGSERSESAAIGIDVQAAPPPETTVTAPVVTTAAPAAPVAPADAFISVLVSLAGTEAEARAYLTSTSSRLGRDLGLLRSDDYASLRAGFWVVFAGPFPSGQEAAYQCWDMGLTTQNSCYGRFVSTTSSDSGRAFLPQRRP